MNKEQIMQVIFNKSLPDSCDNADYLETLNSWVILSDHFAFKIPKPCQATGEDLTEVEDRKDLCYKEFELNKVLTTKVYEGVIPIKKVGNATAGINGTKAEVVDYALKMKRLDDSRKFTENIKRGEINFPLIHRIVSVIISFHLKTRIIDQPPDTKKLQNEFKEIKRCCLFVQEFIGEEYRDIIKQSIITSRRFLKDYQPVLEERARQNRIREIHGNLGADKIYMYHRPVIVDRRILDDVCRQMDVLFDVARLGVDLDFYGMQEYDRLFFTTYITRLGDKPDAQTLNLYNYYKLYHTNLLITKKIDQTTIFNWTDEEKNNLKGLFNLYTHYLGKIEL